MTTFNLQEAQGRLSELITDVFRGDAIVLQDGDKELTLQAGRLLDLKAANGPFKPYSTEAMRAACEQSIPPHH